MSIEYREKGPLFDGRAQQAVDDFIDAAEEDIAQLGFDMVRQELGSVLQNPTGYYESRVQVDLAGEELKIDDGGVVYGPWLEGTGSRNGRSRFKGYATFRRVAQKLQEKAVTVADNLLPKYIDRMS